MPEAEPVLELRRRIDDEDRLATRKLPAVRLPAFDLGSQPDEVTIPLRPAIRRPSVRQVPPPPALPLPLVLKPSVPPVVETLPPPRSRGKLPALLGAGLAYPVYFGTYQLAERFAPIIHRRLIAYRLFRAIAGIPTPATPAVTADSAAQPLTAQPSEPDLGATT